MKEKKNHKIEVPNISIEEALRLYLSLIYPKGLPTGVDIDQLRALLVKKIAKDRPDWDNKFRRKEESKIINTEKSYSQLKQELIQKSRESEVPSDPDEKFFYFRAQEALRNRIMRKEEEKENKKKNELIQRLINSKKGKIYKPSLEKILEIKQIYEAILRNKMIFQKDLPASVKEILLNLEHPQLEYSSYIKLFSPSSNNSSHFDQNRREMNNLFSNPKEKPKDYPELKKTETGSQNLYTKDKKSPINPLSREKNLSIKDKKGDIKSLNSSKNLTIREKKSRFETLQNERFFSPKFNPKPLKITSMEMYEIDENLKIIFRIDKEKDVKLDNIEIF